MRILLPLALLLLTLKSTAGVTHWIDFDLESGHVKIPATIAGIDTHAILDTGSQVNAINKAFIRKHDLTFDKGTKINIKGVFGTEKKSTFKKIPVSFFGIDTTLEQAIEISLGHHTNGFLLGAGFFNQFITQLDYPNSKMRLITHDAIDMTQFRNIEVRRQQGTGMPIVKIGLPDDKHLWLLLDTGNSGGMIIERKIAHHMGWLETLESNASLSMGAITAAEVESFRIPLLEFGPFTVEDVLVTIPAEGRSSNLENQYQKFGSRIKGKKVQGIIGYDVLKHFLITIDYKKGFAHIGLPEE